MTNNFDITRYLPFLVNRTGVQLAGAFSDTITRHGITLQMWRVLAALNHEDGQRIGALADNTSIDVSTLSRLVGTMQRNGLAERRRPESGDARIVTVYATDKGKRITEAIIPAAQHYETIALEGLSAEEESLLKDLLDRVYRNVEDLVKELDETPEIEAA
jgi:MarR family transcriptional regulator, organic hydroperoxide resistance regulator